MKTNAGQIENIFDFQIHYYLNQEDLHKMDAKILNGCERQVLDAFDFIKAYTGEFNIDVGSVLKKCVSPYFSYLCISKKSNKT